MKRKTLFVMIYIFGTVTAFILGVYSLLFANQSTTPDSIARKVGLRLPEYEITKADDNMDRTASSWSDYYYEIEFQEPLSEKYLQKVEKLKNCVREEDSYIIKKESPDEWAGYIRLYPEENRATVEYTFRDGLF